MRVDKGKQKYRRETETELLNQLRAILYVDNVIFNIIDHRFETPSRWIPEKLKRAT